MIEVAFVSSNPGKVREVRDLLRPYGVRVRWRRRTLSEIQAPRLEDVARHKLEQVARSAGWVLVEDSGLFVESLRGFPGVYSAHFLELWGFGPLFELLRGRRRSAAFRTVAGLAHGRTRRFFSGEVRGTIAPRARGTNGFGYDPIFVPDGYRRTFGELPSGTKDALSHRARAMRQVGEYLAGRAARSRIRRKGRKRLGPE